MLLIEPVRLSDLASGGLYTSKQCSLPVGSLIHWP
ncbi:hypothetical protein SLEP1_g14987 [Rubroshorea leprosula]|uniref:Uncharacterized protein n=1 Tax=Rubroshorea leprosula TaxID=152421 RepID=A0AAV5IXJ5_9ROSI|nr:hypothetical protein SLEP1_g14987 [Rubroshorea leprosula]